MSAEGSCPRRVFGYDESSILPTILVLAAFTIGVLSSNFLYSVYGLLATLNSRELSSVKRSSQHDELPKLPANVPKHVAVIMDGNRRYGRLKHSDPLQGHWSGGQTLVDFIQWCVQDGIQVATVYAFSSENWNRDPSEVHTLMSIFAKYAESLTTEASTRNVRVRILSTDFDKLPPKVRSAVSELERATSECTGFLVNICLSYGSRAEIVMACNKAIVAKQRQQEEQKGYDRGQIKEQIMEQVKEQFGQTRGPTPKISESPSASEFSSVDETQHIRHRGVTSPPSRHRDNRGSPDSVINSDLPSEISEAMRTPSDSCKCAHRIKDRRERKLRGEKKEEYDHDCEIACTCQTAGSSSGNRNSWNNSSSSDSVNGSGHHCTHLEQSPSCSPSPSSLLLDEDALSRHMCTADIPDPDILIRTSGEFRISNFLLWQMAYTEMFFVDKFWPEITHRDLRLVLQQYSDRQRRFGV